MDWVKIKYVNRVHISYLRHGRDPISASNTVDIVLPKHWNPYQAVKVAKWLDAVTLKHQYIRIVDQAAFDEQIKNARILVIRVATHSLRSRV
jgi:hypothetical protein